MATDLGRAWTMLAAHDDTDLRLRHVAWTRPHADGWHDHDEGRLVIVTDGAFEERRRHGSGIGCAPGTVLFRRAAERHRNIYAGRGAYICIVFSAAFVAGASGVVLGDDLALRAPHFREIGRRFAWELAHPDRWSSLALHGLTCELVAARHRQRTRTARGRWIADVRDALHEEPLRRTTLAEIAAAAGRSPSEVSRAFKAHFGVGVAGYARGLRIEEARRRIDETDASIAEIATETGFCDQSHLDRAFRQRFGATPSDYRKSRA